MSKLLVDAIQACGGQKTANGKRFRNGGGILLNVMKTRDPNAYKERISMGKEFDVLIGVSFVYILRGTIW